jgi:YHS domain-containing protein
MKSTIKFMVLAGSVLGLLACSNRAEASDAMPGCSMCGTTTTAAAVSTNAIPDLLTTCPVSGDKLNGDMGKPYVFVYKNQEVKLCCKDCKKDFDKNPNKYLAIIRAADKK